MHTLQSSPKANASNQSATSKQTSKTSRNPTPFDTILSLHGTIGNRAVQRLFESGELQAKLNVGAPNDIYEQEADRVADEVMPMPEPDVNAQQPTISPQPQITPLQRMCPECEGELQKQESEEDSELQRTPAENESEKLAKKKDPVTSESSIQRLCSECEEDLQKQESEEDNESESKASIGAREDGLLRQPSDDVKEDEALQRQPVNGEHEKHLRRQALTEKENAVVQTKGTSVETPEVSQAVESTIHAQRGGGQPLPASSRDFFGPRIGADFSGVRVHTGAGADHLNRQLNARAFTTGQDIFFRRGEYNPSGSKGQELLAHELTHVVQQNGATVQRQSLEDKEEIQTNPHLWKSASLYQRPTLGIPIQLRCASCAQEYQSAELQQRPVEHANLCPKCQGRNKILGSLAFSSLDIQRESKSKDSDIQVSVDYAKTGDQIKWYASYATGEIFLVIHLDIESRKRLSDQQLFETSVAVLEAETGIRFEGHKRKEFIKFLTDKTANNGVQNIFHISFVHKQLKGRVGDKEWRHVVDLVKTEMGSQRSGTPLIASGNFDIGAAGSAKEDETGRKAKPKLPAWTKKRKKQLERLIAKERKKKPRPKDLPDRLVPFATKKRKNISISPWWMIVWVHFDTRGKDKSGISIPLKLGESAEQLLVRVRAATVRALQKAEDTDQGRKERELPEWALRFKKKLWSRLKRLRGKNRGASNFPDGLRFIVERWKTITLTAVGTKSIPTADTSNSFWSKIFIQIWVERPVKRYYGQTKERNFGTVPVPLTPKTSPDSFIPYIRHMAALLRQFEKAPHREQPLGKDTDQEPLEPNTALRAFPAVIRPIDLRSDRTTVTSANNKFQMQLDYGDVYGAAGDAFYHALKLMHQSIYFDWELYKVPNDPQLEQGKKSIPIDWSRRWAVLYKSYNAKGKEGVSNLEKLEDRTIQALGRTVTVTKYSKTKFSTSLSRIKFPEQAGDYMVHCQTRHSPIGKYRLQRNPSVAYFPVRVKPIKDVAKAAVGRRKAAIKTTAAELKDIITKLKTYENIHALSEGDATQREILEVLREEKENELKRLKAKESPKFIKATTDEINYAEGKLKLAKELRRIRPLIIKRAKAKNQKPSTFLRDKPELLTLYWYLVAEGKTADGYIEELKHDIERLKGLKKRALKRKKAFKASSDYMYSPEAAFVSRVTGHVYPLVLRLGESPKSPRGGIMYSLVDITSPQTVATYTGWTLGSEPKHHREAIDNAFKDFGESEIYGEGIIAVRIPPPSQTDDPDVGNEAGKKKNNYHPGTGVKYYKSEAGLLQKVLKALGFIAAAAGVAALAATGIGAPTAAAILGAVAAAAGAVTSIHNISERSRRGKLAWDAEMALDIIGIIGAIPALQSAKLATQGRNLSRVGFKNPSWYSHHLRTARFLQIYGTVETGATVILVPIKLAQDINRIENDPELDPEQKKRLIAEAKRGAAQAGLMMLGSGVISAHHRMQSGRQPAWKDADALKKQTELLELEGFGKYKWMKEQGLLDKDGNWTARAREIMGPKTIKEAKYRTPGIDIADKPTNAKAQKFLEDTGLSLKELNAELNQVSQAIKGGDVKPSSEEPKIYDIEIEINTIHTKHTWRRKRSDEGKMIWCRFSKKGCISLDDLGIKNLKGKEKPSIESKRDLGSKKKTGKKTQAESMLDAKIKDAEFHVERAKQETRLFEDQAKKAKDAAKRAETEAKKAKGQARKEAKQAAADAKNAAKEAVQMAELAREQEARLKENATNLRQKKLSSAIDEAQAQEKPWAEKVQQKQNELKRLEEKRKVKHREKNRLRELMRNETKKPQEENRKLKERIDQLDHQIRRNLNKQIESLWRALKADKDQLVKRQSQTRKKIEALEAEKRAALGITDTLYNRLRRKSPSDAIKDQFRLETHDAIYGEPMKERTVDHIVSMNEITQMPGFNRLTFDQQVEVLNCCGNFMALDRRVNSSKHLRTFNEWKGYSEWGEIPKQKRQELIELEATLRKAIIKAIEERDPLKKKSAT